VAEPHPTAAGTAVSQPARVSRPPTIPVGGANPDKGHRGSQPSSAQKLGKKRSRERRVSVQDVEEELELIHDERREVHDWHMYAVAARSTNPHSSSWGVCDAMFRGPPG
jgi:hypothetical protein